MSKKEKRPSWLHPIARAKWDGSMRTYKDIQARILPKETAEQYDIDIPPTWTEQPAMFLLRGLGWGKRGLPSGSGVGLVQSPYADIYTKVYGVNPIADLPKYRQMYRNHPDIQQAVQMQVNLALGKGFTIGHKDEEVVKYLEKKRKELKLIQHMLVMGSDSLIYGNSYTEIQWDKKIKVNEQMYDFHGSYYTANDLKDLNLRSREIKKATISEDGNRSFIAERIAKDPEAKTIVALKDLDPLYMRVRRDSWGNQYGYIQWMAFPPVLIDNESCIHIRYRPMSWGYESAYGTSILMPIIKNTELLEQFENDAATWIHSKAVPPLIVKGGLPEKPYSTPQMQELMKQLSTRTAATMMFTKGDVTFEELKTIASDLNLDWWINFILLRRYQALSVPSILMGVTARSSKGAAEVLLHDFVARLQVLQEFISDTVEEYIFRPLINQKFGEKTENAQIIWKPIIEEDKNMRSQRLIQLLQAGAITINETREEMGFKMLHGKRYDELTTVEPGTNPTGFPPRTGPSGIPKPKPAGAGGESKEVQQKTTKPPEGHMKLEDLRTKKIELMQLEENFREKMLDLTRKTKFELKDDGKLVQEVRREAKEAADEIINENIAASYLLGRMNANSSLGKEDDLTLKQEDLSHLASLKDKCVNDFDIIVNDMVKAKEEGKLE